MLSNPLIAQPLSGIPNCGLYWFAPVWGQCIPPTHTITHHLPNAEQIRFVLCHGRVFLLLKLLYDSNQLSVYRLKHFLGKRAFFGNCFEFLVQIHLTNEHKF